MTLQEAVTNVLDNHSYICTHDHRPGETRLCEKEHLLDLAQEIAGTIEDALREQLFNELNAKSRSIASCALSLDDKLISRGWQDAAFFINNGRELPEDISSNMSREDYLWFLNKYGVEALFRLNKYLDNLDKTVARITSERGYK